MKLVKTILSSTMVMAIFILLLTALPVSTALAYTVGPNNPSSGVDLPGVGSVTWQNPGNISQPGSPYASAILTGRVSTHYLNGTGYGFVIPTDATIRGIELQINRQVIEHNAGLQDNIVRLVRDGTIVGDNKAITTTWSTAFTLVTYGGPTDLWGTTWTPADINDSDFGAVLSVNRTNNGTNDRTALVDNLQITVFYAYDSSMTLTCGDGSPVVYGEEVTCTATVTRLTGNQTPDGLISWTTNGTGTFLPTPCQLVGSNGVSSCTSTYTPSAVGTGTHVVTASYNGGQYFIPEIATDSVTVDQRPITVTADPQTKVYGSPDPEFTYTYTPTLVFSDAFTGTLSREPGEAVGSYAITQGSLALNDNYDLTYIGNFLEITLLAADCTVDPYTITYDGLEHAATGICLGAAGETLEGLDLSQTIHSDASVYTDTWSFTDLTGNYADQAGTVVDTINKTDAVCTVTPYDVPYDGDSHTATGSCIGVLDEELTSLDLSGTTHTNAGVYTDSWTFSNTNYNDQAGTVDDNISVVDAICSVAGWAGQYDGNAHGASGACLGVDGLPLEGLDLGETFTNVPGGTASWLFSDPNGNYNTDSGNVDILISKAAPNCAIVGWTGTYDGNAHGATGDCLGVDGLPLEGLDLGNTFTDVPGGSVTWTFTDVTGNYNDLSDSVDIVIGKANASCPIEGWTGPYDGETHGASGACLGVDGLPLEGLDLGNSFTDVPGGTANWTFTDVTGNYNDLSDSVEISISKVNPTCQIDFYSVEFDKQAHTATGSCDGVKDEPLTGLDLSGTTHTEVGSYIGDPWNFTDSTGNYNDMTGTVDDEITKILITVKADPQVKLLGKYDPAFTYKVTDGTLLEGDTFTGKLSRLPGETPGTYPILQGTLALPDYYEIIYVEANLTIIGNFIYLPMMHKF